MKLNFVIDETYLVAYSLSSMSEDRFSSKKYKKDIVAFQDYAWSKSKRYYNFLISRFSPEMWLDTGMKIFIKELPVYLDVLKHSGHYERLFSQTKDYMHTCRDQWSRNYEISSTTMKELTGLKFKKSIRVFITHPGLKNGCYLGDNKIAWGHNEDWSNYTTVYLWHEILHSYFSKTDLDHVIISLLTDEELRIRFNGGKYPPFLGHKELLPRMKKILPYWRNYLRSDKKNIIEFKKELIKLKI